MNIEVGTVLYENPRKLPHGPADESVCIKRRVTRVDGGNLWTDDGRRWLIRYSQIVQYGTVRRYKSTYIFLKPTDGAAEMTQEEFDAEAKRRNDEHYAREHQHRVDFLAEKGIEGVMKKLEATDGYGMRHEAVRFWEIIPEADQRDFVEHLVDALADSQRRIRNMQQRMKTVAHQLVETAESRY